MQVTEAVAQNKWCCHARIVVSNAGMHMAAINVLPPSDQMPQGQKIPCIGSACMMWCWIDSPSQEQIEAGKAKGQCGLVQDNGTEIIMKKTPAKKK